ncbi:MAG: hypothetical protein GEU81_12440, partial [Nitriliruptorales bacterium]|nr:hypothetical protein [Nitriliruptorales bacterium]
MSFRSRPLPPALDTAVRRRLADAHEQEPFSPLRVRQAASRVADIVKEVGLTVAVYRGGLDLRGVEVDHLWLAAVQGFDSAEAKPRGQEPPFVLDVAFPLFDQGFVAALRRFVAGDGTHEELAAAAEIAHVNDRVVGVIPPP